MLITWGQPWHPHGLDTLLAHFKETGRNPSYYDIILSGDLGYVGKEILIELARNEWI